MKKLLKYYNKSIEINPNDPMGYRNKAFILFIDIKKV